MVNPDVIEDVLSSIPNRIKHGMLNEKILLELKMSTSLYEYMEVVTNYYDDDENPNRNNWTDIEGMGYGWRWLKYENEESKWYEMMCKMVAEECEHLMGSVQKAYYIVYENGRGKIYHFINFNGDRTDTIITLSNNELWV